MGKKYVIVVLIVSLLLSAFTSCKKAPSEESVTDPPTTPPSASDGTTDYDPAEAVTADFSGNAVTAYHIADLANEEGLVKMLILLSDGWILDTSLRMLYPITAEDVFGVRYSAISDDIFVWAPAEQDIETLETDDPNFRMRIIYSDPEGRFIVYSPDVAQPTLANIIMNPDAFPEIADEESETVDDEYRYFYRIKENALKDLSNTLNLLTYDDYVNPGF